MLETLTLKKLTVICNTNIVGTEAELYHLADEFKPQIQLLLLLFTPCQCLLAA